VRPFVRFSLHRGVRDKTLLVDTTTSAKFSNTLDRAAKLHDVSTPSPLYTADLTGNGLANQERYPAFEDVYSLQLNKFAVLAGTKSGRQRTSSVFGFISKPKNLLRIPSQDGRMFPSRTVDEERKCPAGDTHSSSGPSLTSNMRAWRSLPWQWGGLQSSLIRWGD
jgi:hypothetical protein